MGEESHVLKSDTQKRKIDREKARQRKISLAECRSTMFAMSATVQRAQRIIHLEISFSCTRPLRLYEFLSVYIKLR